LPVVFQAQQHVERARQAQTSTVDWSAELQSAEAEAIALLNLQNMSEAISRAAEVEAAKAQAREVVARRQVEHEAQARAGAQALEAAQAKVSEAVRSALRDELGDYDELLQELARARGWLMNSVNAYLQKFVSQRTQDAGAPERLLERPMKKNLEDPGLIKEQDKPSWFTKFCLGIKHSLLFIIAIVSFVVMTYSGIAFTKNHLSVNLLITAACGLIVIKIIIYFRDFNLKSLGCLLMPLAIICVYAMFYLMINFYEDPGLYSLIAILAYGFIIDKAVYFSKRIKELTGGRL